MSWSLFQRNNLKWAFSWELFWTKWLIRKWRREKTGSLIWWRCAQLSLKRLPPPNSRFNKSCKFQLLQTRLKADRHGRLINFLDGCHQQGLQLGQTPFNIWTPKSRFGEFLLKLLCVACRIPITCSGVISQVIQNMYQVSQWLGVQV